MHERTTIRKATVQTVAALSGLGLLYADSPLGGPPVPRPLVGGLTSGLHTVPVVGDQVAVLYETTLAGSPPLCTVSVTDKPAALPALSPGETLLLHPSGAYLKFSNAGPVTLFVSSSLQLVLDPATNRVDVTATGGLYVNGVQVVTP